jgi:hypothetical protein
MNYRRGDIVLVGNPLGPGYSRSMAGVKSDLDKPVVMTDAEDEETLAAIDQGIHDADAGRLTPLEEVDKMLPQWISKFSYQKRR